MSAAAPDPGRSRGVPEGVPDARSDAPPSMVGPVLLLLLSVASLALVYASPLRAWVGPEGVGRMREALVATGAWSPAVFLGACIAGVALGVPRLVFAAAAGLLYGWALGFVLAHVGATVGNLLAFAWSRRLGREAVARRAGPRLQRLLEAVRRRPIGTNVLLRVCPVGSSFMVSLMFGLSPVTATQFAVGTFLGMLPGTLALSLFGGSVAAGSNPALLLGGALLLGLLVASRLLARRARAVTDPALPPGGAGGHGEAAGA